MDHPERHHHGDAGDSGTDAWREEEMKAVIIFLIALIVLLDVGLCMADDPYQDDDEKSWSGLLEEDE